MPFEFKKTEIEGLMLIKPHMYPDERGLYKKYYEKNIFAENGITCEFTESSDLYSKKGALRGLHYQTVDSQAKLIHVISGVLFDVALDLRENSPTFGQYHTELLKAEDQFVTYIPEGFAHGFISLTNDTIFSYQCSGRYVPSACGGIRWNDPELNIPWPLAVLFLYSSLLPIIIALTGRFEGQLEFLSGGISMYWPYWLIMSLPIFLLFRRYNVRRSMDEEYSFLYLMFALSIILFQVIGINSESYRISLYFMQFLILLMVKSGCTEYQTFRIILERWCILIFLGAYYVYFFIIALFNHVYPYTSSMLGI